MKYRLQGIDENYKFEQLGSSHDIDELINLAYEYDNLYEVYIIEKEGKFYYEIVKKITHEEIVKQKIKRK